MQHLGMVVLAAIVDPRRPLAEAKLLAVILAHGLPDAGNRDQLPDFKAAGTGGGDGTGDGSGSASAAPPVLAYPNVVAAGSSAMVNFSNVLADSTINVYTLSGKLVGSVAAPGGTGAWNTKVPSGGNAMKGLYLYSVKDAGGTPRTGKLILN